MLPGDRVILVNGKQINSSDAIAVHKASAEFSATVLRNGKEVIVSATKASADAPLGINVKRGVDACIDALCEALKSSTTLISLKYASQLESIITVISPQRHACRLCTVLGTTVWTINPGRPSERQLERPAAARMKALSCSSSKRHLHETLLFLCGSRVQKSSCCGLPKAASKRLRAFRSFRNKCMNREVNAASP